MKMGEDEFYLLMDNGSVINYSNHQVENFLDTLLAMTNIDLITINDIDSPELKTFGN